jgi:hypothetical protein
MILLEAGYEDNMIRGHIIHNKENKSFDTIPKLNTDIILVVSYVNIGFDSETLIANQVWGFSPKESWIVKEIEEPMNSKNAVLKLKEELEPGSWRLDRETQWRTYYNSKTGWLCIGDPEITMNDDCINFLQNAVSTLNQKGELKALWIHL